MHSYAAGTVVDLEATAASGSSFTGWSGACSGKGTCSLTMSADRNVNASFKKKAEPQPPNTKITRSRIRARKGSAQIAFKSVGAATGFQCALTRKRAKSRGQGRGKFRTCSSPKRYKRLRRGRYTFKVRAVNAVGPDPTPAKLSFKSKR